ncbi:hypothetical protein C8Q70DRAFT_1106615 [Cubamyces menziesii]|nr:hypothetical protein C8Q70DRAFT_1106615 [Cubamyces menziesii]
MDTGQYTSAVDDSLFDKAWDHQNSTPSESVFGFDSSLKQDDTMITMHAGGHVPRRSVSSLAEVALCVQVERHQRTALPVRVSQSGMELLRSIASTSSYECGGEHMIKAFQGLFEQQSLEDSALVAYGEGLIASRAVREC